MPPLLIHSYLVYTIDGVTYAVPCLKSSEATLLGYWLSTRGIESVAVPSGHASTSVVNLPRDPNLLFKAAREIYDSDCKYVKIRNAKHNIRGTARRLIKPAEIVKTRHRYEEIRRPKNESRNNA